MCSLRRAHTSISLSSPCFVGISIIDGAPTHQTATAATGSQPILNLLKSLYLGLVPVCNKCKTVPMAFTMSPSGKVAGCHRPVML